MDEPVWMVTGGAGFLGSGFIRHVTGKGLASIVNVDSLTYAGNLKNITPMWDHPKHNLIIMHITDFADDTQFLEDHKPDIIINFAAESHVDHSLTNSDQTFETNTRGVYNLLQTVLSYWQDLPEDRKEKFRFIQISTDEVYGNTGNNYAHEDSMLRPSTPYAASKAAADMFCNAYRVSYGLPVIVVRMTNIFGPYQHPEKFIPKTILAALKGAPITIHGDGSHSRDWLHLDDFCRVMEEIVSRKRKCKIYNICGDGKARSNLGVAHNILNILETRDAQILHVPDRKGNDHIYSMGDSNKLGEPQVPFHIGLARTVRWYEENQDWVESCKYKGEP